MQKAYIKYILALLLFGSNGIVASWIDLPSTQIVLLRTFIGSLLLLMLFKLSQAQLTFWQNRRHLSFLILSGMAMGASWMFLYEAYQLIGVSLATLAYYCGPMIVMVLSPLLFRENLTLSKLMGFAVVLAGFFLINHQAYQDGKSALGLFYGGLSAVLYAVMVILNKKAKSIQGLENAMLQLLVSFLTVAVYVGLRQGYIIHIPGGSWLPILILGLVNTGMGCYLYFSSIGHLPVQTVAVSGYLDPLAAVLLSVALLGEVLQPVQILGAFLILAGAFVGEGLWCRREARGA
ncbi:MAG: EamA family transporter [Clostridia bacterium]|nr:EamA family transporter [Clostridia bacterium]NCC75895.1 EamA family transporter [Clostridia bacterium]